jgi:hypothetical protein
MDAAAQAAVAAGDDVFSTDEFSERDEAVGNQFRVPDSGAVWPAMRRYLAVHRARAEDFVFTQWFNGGAGDGSNGNGITHRVEDFDGVPFRPIRCDVIVDKLDDIAPLKPMLWNIARQDGVGIEF